MVGQIASVCAYLKLTEKTPRNKSVGEQQHLKRYVYGTVQSAMVCFVEGKRRWKKWLGNLNVGVLRGFQDAVLAAVYSDKLHVIKPSIVMLNAHFWPWYPMCFGHAAISLKCEYRIKETKE